MADTAQLIALPYSPWSEKARFALDHCRVAYREREYLPLFGEPLLRLRMRRVRRKATVPVLFTPDGRAIGDSLAIARWADEQRAPGMETLFPPEHSATVEHYNAMSEAALAAGRARVTRSVAADADARRESVPLFFRPLAGPVSSLGIWFLQKKYGFSLHERTDAREPIIVALEVVEKALRSGRRYLLDRFSYADIALSLVVQFVSPVADSHIPLGPNARRCWADGELAERFAGVVAWRDAIYRDHRR